VQNMGLATKGWMFLSLTNNEVPTQEIKEFFGPKVSKMGIGMTKRLVPR